MADLRKISALILDDNAHMRELLKVNLSAFGLVHIHQASNSLGALAMLDKAEVDMAFVDLKLGDQSGLGGIEFCRDLRKRAEPELHFLPLIVVTAYSELRYIKQAIDAGADEFLVKPVSPAAMADRINAVIERRRPFITALDYVGPDRRRRRDKKFEGPFRRFDDAGDIEI